ncbi:hypothetical protein ACH0C8_15360, partial [Acetobacter lovaniensis]
TPPVITQEMESQKKAQNQRVLRTLHVSTKLRNIHEHGEGGLRESWIDDFLGHESHDKSVGSTVYFDDVDIVNLKKVAESVKYPDYWNLNNLFIQKIKS